MITMLLQFIPFLKVFILFLAILNCIQEIFRLYKSIKKEKIYENTKLGILILGMSIAYILSIIVI